MVEIFFSYSEGLKENLPFEAIVQKVATAADLGALALLNVHFSDVAEMTALNKQWRGKDGTTDVLSFEGDGEGEKSRGPRILGDIVICIPQAQQQANEMKHPLDQEIAVLAAHGLLHLLGHDHELGDEDSKAQADAESKLLAEAGFPNVSGLIVR